MNAVVDNYIDGRLDEAGVREAIRALRPGRCLKLRPAHVQKLVDDASGAKKSALAHQDLQRRLGEYGVTSTWSWENYPSLVFYRQLRVPRSLS
jgi:hypothetical protein